jgi:hypothetical protein
MERGGWRIAELDCSYKNIATEGIFEDTPASPPTTTGTDWYNAVSELMNGNPQENTTHLPYNTVVPHYVTSALETQATSYLALCGLGTEHHADCYAVCETGAYTVYATDISYSDGYDSPIYFTVYHAYEGSELVGKVIFRHQIPFYDTLHESHVNAMYITMEDVVTMAKKQFEAFYAENKNYMNGSRGHGYAAEYGNNAVDRFLMRDVENAAQQLENGHQIKNGADRVVNGAQIQTKYYQSASESIGAAFEHKQAKYTYIDSTGTEKMMEIEVPRDQYADALRLMQKRIDSGQVPNVEPGEDARNYVRKGFFTYDQSYCIAQSGTIESLKVDALSGAVCCSQVAGITAAIVFAISIWNGQSAEEALKQSLGTGLKVLGKGTLIYTLTMQLSRDSFSNLIEGKNIVNEVSKGYFTIDNPVFTLSENLASKISSSGVAQTGIGEILGLENITGKEVIGGAVTVAVVFGPDIARALVGRISPKQLAKNASVGLAGMIGGIIGQSLIPIPVVGAMVGSITTSFVVKKALDVFIEDDAKEMFRILKEEFLDTTMLAGLNPEEFEEIVSLTVGHKKLPKQLQKMYQSQEFRRYAREAIMLPAINSVFSKRQVVTNDVFVKELKLLSETT